MRTFVFMLLSSGLLISCRSLSSSQTEKTKDMANKDWIKKTNIYEVNLRQYTKEGSFDAFAQHLPRLKAMGVETLWFMPVTPIAQKNKKGTLGSYYAAADYTAINPEFGTMDDFKALVKAAHARGFKVIIDWVANHTGWDHRWTREHPDWYEKDATTNDFKIASGMDDIIELNFKNPQLRKAMIDAMQYWVEEGEVDGFRCDLAFWVELDFWQEAKRELDKVKPLFWLAELDPLEHPDYMQVFDAAYTWTWMHKTREFYQNKLPLASLDSVLNQYDKAPGMKAWFTTNHDENSWNGTEYEKYGDAAKALAVFSCTWPGVPLIYSGQELPNKKRLEFFEKDPIQWNGNFELADFYKTLFTLRFTNTALHADSRNTRLSTSQNEQVLAYARQSGEGEVVVFLNLSQNNQRFALSGNEIKGKYRNVFSKSEEDFSAGKEIELKAWDFAVFEK